jgi:hypothetical protein
MIETMNPKIADVFIDSLSDGGSEARAKKAVRTYRNDPTDDTAIRALAAVNDLDRNKRTELKQAARL